MAEKRRNVERRRAAAQMHALAAVRQDIGPRDRAAGRKYLREFSLAFRDYDRAVNAEELHQRAAATDIILIGDYHALPASQRFAASLAESLAHSRPVVVGVEAVLSRDQAILDAWWRREIVEEELRQQLRFDRDWGYEWDPFFELLSVARDHAEGIYGLDCLPRNDLRRIRSRDRHAAAKICEIRERHPKACILVLFGESHLAPQHLPALLRKGLPGDRLLAILQNIDALYWKAGSEQAAAVSITGDALCVFNSTPLEKYESYRLCIDRWSGDDQPDFAPAVYNLIFSLARTLGFRPHCPQKQTQPKFFADSLPEVVTVDDRADETQPGRGSPFFSTRTQPDRHHISSALNERGCVYIPAANTFFVREFKMPWAAAEAARFLYHAGDGSAAAHDQKLEATLAHFGARLMCPQSACEAGLCSPNGEALYQRYVSGKLSKAAVRRMFLERQ